MSPPGAAPGEGAPLGERAAWVRDRIADAVRRSGRPAGSVKLVAVSKTRPLARILEAHAAGLSVFGENYVQEAEEKIPGLPGAEWHLIGRLQGNKVRRAVALFSWIQTADSAKRLSEISRCAVEAGKIVPVLLEVNVGAEEGKGKSSRLDLSNLHIQRYGDTAIASYTLLASTADGDGVKVAAHNESRVMVKLEGKWKVVHVHKSPAYPAPHTQDK